MSEANSFITALIFDVRYTLAQHVELLTDGLRGRLFLFDIFNEPFNAIRVIFIY